MKALFKQHYEAIKLRGLITPDTAFHTYVNEAEKSLCSWVDNKDPEDAVKLICVVSDWLLSNEYDLEAILKEVANNELNKVLDCEYVKP